MLHLTEALLDENVSGVTEKWKKCQAACCWKAAYIPLVIKRKNGAQAGVEQTSGSEQRFSYQSNTGLQDNIHVGSCFNVARQCFHVNSFWRIHTERASWGFQPKATQLSIMGVQRPSILCVCCFRYFKDLKIFSSLVSRYIIWKHWITC